MCVEKLICKEKLACSGSSVVFSTIGHIEPKIKIVAVVVKALGPYVLTLKDGDEVLKTLDRVGSGSYEFVMLDGLSLPIPHVFEITISNGELFELNLATICLCDVEKC
jgi:hypothetical protein